LKTDLSKFNNSWYNPGGGKIKRLIWYITNSLLFKSYLLPFSSIKCEVLKLFGAQIGKEVVIKPNVNIKYPWNLTVGDYSWIGEEVWIDNLDKVVIGKNVCISQGALILSGNHNYKKPSFDLMIAPIIIEDGAWIGAKSIVTQGVTIGTHAVLTVNSVASSSLEPYGIYRGNPAQKIKHRNIEA
jgi:putative colanic acid biosynthesis acetyltransferase WcaF